MASLNGYFVYGKLTQKEFSYLDFQVTLVKSLTDNYNNWRRNQQKSATTNRISGNFPTEILSQKN